MTMSSLKKKIAKFPKNWLGPQNCVNSVNFLGRAVARAPISGFFCPSACLSLLAYCLNDQAHFA